MYESQANLTARVTLPCRVVDKEVARFTYLTKQQRKELMYVIELLHKTLATDQTMDEAAKRRVKAWIGCLVGFQHEYERRWHMDSEGNALPDNCCQSCLGITYSKELRDHIEFQLTEAKKIEEDLEGIENPMERELRLVAYQRVDFLSR